MRKCVARVMVVTMAAVLLAPQTADAGLLGWLSRLSGPGPFWGVEASLGVKCFGIKEDAPTTAGGDQPPTRPTTEGMNGLVVPCPKSKLDDRHATLYVIAGGAIAENNPLNYGDSGRPDKSTAVRLLKGGAALDFTVMPAIDLGFGAGVLYFAGPRFDNFARAYVEPARIAIRPLVWTKSQTASERLERRGWLMVSASWTILLGEVKGSTFGAPLDALDENNESLLSLGLSIDVIRLLKNFR